MCTTGQGAAARGPKQRSACPGKWPGGSSRVGAPRSRPPRADVGAGRWACRGRGRDARNRSPPSRPRGARCGWDRRSHPALRYVRPSSSRLVFELDPADADRVPRLDPGPLQSFVDTKAVELDLKAFERTLRVEVGVLNEVLDSSALDLEPPRLPFDHQVGAYHRQLDRRRPGRRPRLGRARDRAQHRIRQLTQAGSGQRGSEMDPLAPRTLAKFFSLLEVQLVDHRDVWTAGKLRREALDL